MPNSSQSVRSGPEYSWSFSRGKQFDDCARAYYYARYLAPQGAAPGAEPRLKEMLGMSKLSSVPLFKGEAVHAAMETYCKEARRALEKESGDKYSRATHDKFVKLAFHTLTTTLSTKLKQSAQLAKAKKLPVYKSDFLLREHWQDKTVDPVELMASARETMEGFCEYLYDTLLEEGSVIMGTEELSVLKGFRHKVWVKLDLALWTPSQDMLSIVDWKTGRPGSSHSESYASQLAIYALWASGQYDVPAQAVDMLLVYPEGHVQRTEPLEEADLKAVKSFIERSMKKQTGMLKNIARNVPKPLKAFEPISYSGSAPGCKWCPFKSYCIEDCSE